MKKKIIVREATINDLVGIAQIVFNRWHSDSRLLDGQVLLNEIYIKEFEKRLIKQFFDRSKILIMLEKAMIVGFLVYSFVENRVVELQTIFIIPQKRQQGLASKLFRHFIATLQANKIDHVVTWLTNKNRDAKSFYTRMGFSKQNTRIIDLDGVPLKEVQLRFNGARP